MSIFETLLQTEGGRRSPLFLELPYTDRGSDSGAGSAHSAYGMLTLCNNHSVRAPTLYCAGSDDIAAAMSALRS